MKRTAGFSLVEVLCALLILGAGVVGITESIALSLRWSGEAERVTRAQELAAGRLDTLKTAGYLTEGEDEGTFDEFPLYRYRQTITETSPKGLYEVTVTVTFDRAAAEGETEAEPLCELKTLFFEKPVTSSFDTDPRTESGRKNRRDQRRGGKGER